MPRTGASRSRTVLVALAVGGVLLLAAVAAASVPPAARAQSSLPASLAAVGDSIVSGYAATGQPADELAESFVSGSDGNVQSHFLRLQAAGSSIDATHDLNLAADGKTMADMQAQADEAVSAGAQYVVLMAGTNDVCTALATGADPTANMTDPTTFANEFQQALSTLSSGLPDATLLVVSIPDWVAMYESLKADAAARAAWASHDNCPTVLDQSETDANRAAVEQRIQALNDKLQQGCAQVAHCHYADVSAFPWQASYLNSLDYFHFSVAGQAKLAALTWDATIFGGGSSTTTVALGNTNQGGSSIAPNASDFIDVSGAHSIGTGGTVSKALGYLAGGSSAVPLRAVVYSDSGGSPGSLVGVSNETTLAANASPAWVEFDFPSALQLQAGSYWIGYWIGGDGATYYFDAGTDSFMPSTYSSTGGAPASFASSGTGTSDFSLYAPLDQGGSGGGGTTTLGNAHAGSNHSPENALDFLDVTGPYTQSAAGTVTTMHGYLAGAAGGDVPLRAVVYADDGSGHPGALVAVTAPTTIPQDTGSTPTPHWFEFAFASPVHLSAGRYWLGYWIGGNGVTYYFDNGAAGSEFFERDTYSSSGSPDDPFGTGTASPSPTSQFSLYATVTADQSGGGSTTTTTTTTTTIAATTTAATTATATVAASPATTEAAATTPAQGGPPPPKSRSPLALDGTARPVRVVHLAGAQVPTIAWSFSVSGADYVVVGVERFGSAAGWLPILPPSRLGEVRSGKPHTLLIVRNGESATLPLLVHLRRRSLQAHRTYVLVVTAHRLDGTFTTLRKTFVVG